MEAPACRNGCPAQDGGALKGSGIFYPQRFLSLPFYTHISQSRQSVTSLKKFFQKFTAPLPLGK